MKNILRAALFIAGVIGTAYSELPITARQLVGVYRYYMVGGTWTLALQSEGTYSLTAQGSRVDSKPQLVEDGTWTLEDLSVILKNTSVTSNQTDIDYRRLYAVGTTDGAFALVSALRADYIGQPSEQSPTRYTFVRALKQKPNQALEPTPTAGMPAAAQPSRQP